MMNLTTNHQVIIASILAVLVLLFVKWLFTPTTSKNTTLRMPQQNKVFWGLAQFTAYDLRNPHEASDDASQVCFRKTSYYPERNTSEWWFETQDVRNILDIVAEANCLDEEAIITVATKDPHERRKDNHPASINISISRFSERHLPIYPPSIDYTPISQRG